MSQTATISMAPPDTSSTPKTSRAKPRPLERPAPQRQPFYHVVLHDDNDHTYAYVIEMIIRLFGYSMEKSFTLAEEVDTTGRAIIDTTTLERAELKRDQIRSFGRDERLNRSQGCMTVTLEPVPA